MQFMYSEEQLAFAEAIDDIVEGHGSTQVTRDWAAGNKSSGLALWEQFAELGLGAIRVPEDQGGMGGSLVDLVAVFERFGYHAVPGPYVESMALLPQLVSGSDRDAIAGGAVATAAVEGFHPHALDADQASLIFTIAGGSLTAAEIVRPLESMSPMRALFDLSGTGTPNVLDPQTLTSALNEATVANTAMLLGAGERLLHEAVEYAKVREQFGRVIGEYQALKHQLADVRIALSFARPLLWQAAISSEANSATSARDVSAAKIKAAEAAVLAAKASLQVHGAIGYTSEHDLSIWLNWVPALVGVWGTPAFHRNRVAKAIEV